MKPVTVSPSMKSSEDFVPEIKSENSSDSENIVEKSLLDAIRNTYISETSREVFSEHFYFGQVPKISEERMIIIQDIVQKFMSLTDTERLMVFLRLPIASEIVTSSTFESKLGVLTSRVEIRRTAAWIRSHLQADSESSIPKRDVYAKYTEYCQSSRMAPISIADFGKLMKQMYPSVRPRRLGTRGKSQYCYAGMTSCQDLKRPDLYEGCAKSCKSIEDTGDQCSMEIKTQITNNENFYHKSSILPEFTEENSTRESVTYDEVFPNKHWYQDTSKPEVSERKTKLYKPTTISQKGRIRRLVHQRSHDNTLCIDQADGPVEDEVAQYFQSEQFRRPLKLVKSMSARSSLEKPFYRSFSYTNGCHEEVGHQSRSQTSVGVYGPLNNFESPVNYYRPLGSVEQVPTTEAADQLAQLQLRPRSNLSRASIEYCSNSACTTQDFGFTPIAPSPILQNGMLQNEKIHQENQSIRPRCFSDAKWALKRDFRNAFQRNTVVNHSFFEENKPEDRPQLESSRSQSLPSFRENRLQQLPQNISEIPSQAPPDAFVAEPMTCEEFAQILENTMAVENVSFTDNENSFLPQLDNLLNVIKPPEDISTSQEERTTIDFSPMNTSEANSGVYRDGFEEYF